MYCALYDFATWAAGLQSAASVICPVMWPSWAPAARSYPTMSLQVSFESLTTLKMFVTLDIFQEIYLSSVLSWLSRKWLFNFKYPRLFHADSQIKLHSAFNCLYFDFVRSITIPLQGKVTDIHDMNKHGHGSEYSLFLFEVLLWLQSDCISEVPFQCWFEDSHRCLHKNTTSWLLSEPKI